MLLQLIRNITVISPNKSKSKILDLCDDTYPCILNLSLNVTGTYGKNLIVIINPNNGKRASSQISTLEKVLGSIEYSVLD